MTIEPSLSLSEIVRNVSESRDLLNDIFNKISNINTENDILKVSVEIVHETLECDRVIVYSLLSSSQGKIIAESVTPGYSPTLDSVIKDPCFEARYISKYEKGRVRAITDIYKAGMSSCYIENLEKIEVKANLLVPLIHPEGYLYGLLIMHQCSQPRQWKQLETKFALTVANWTMKNIAHITNYEQLKIDLENNHKWEKCRKELTIEIHRQANINDVLKIAVEQSKKILNCDRVVVYCLQDQQMGKIIAEASVEALAPILNMIIEDPCFEYGYKAEYQQGRVKAVNNIYTAEMTPCYVNNLARIGVKSNLVVPINWDNGTIYGLLVAHQCFDFRDWQDYEIEWMREIAIQTGLSLSKAKLKEEIKSTISGVASLEIARDSITIAKSKVKEIQQPLKDSSGTITEISNLYKLLNREINSLDRIASTEVVKETKLTKIMLKKLSVAIAKLNNALGKFNNANNTLGEILEDAAVNLYKSNQSDN